MKRSLKDWVVITICVVFGIPLVALLIALGIDTKRVQPDNALLLVDVGAKEYFAPSCLMRGSFDSAAAIRLWAATKGMEVITYDQLKGRGLRPNAECRDGVGFFQEGRSLGGSYLQSIGLLNALPSRWNADGSWNW